MKITKIIIKNYRSIKEQEIDTANFSVFVGQNNHGKTNLFEAVEWFYNAKKSEPEECFGNNGTNEISVELFFEDVQREDIEKLKTDAHKTKIKQLLEEETAFSIRKTSNDHKRSYIVAGQDKGNPAGLDTAINEFVPKLEYVNTKIRLEDVKAYKNTNPIGIMLKGVLGRIIQDDPQYIEFVERFDKLFNGKGSKIREEIESLQGDVEVYLRKQFPEGVSVEFNISDPNFDDLLKGFDTSIDDGVETKAEDKGDGMQRAIMLAILQAYADYRRNEKSGMTFLFLIDEAELHLHPSAQRKLKEALRDISERGDQVLINTHSSVFVVDSKDDEKVFQVEKINKETIVHVVDDSSKTQVIFGLLGGSPADLLLPSNFLIVEGRSEKEFIQSVINRFYKEEYKNILIVSADGDVDKSRKTFDAINNVYKTLSEGIYKGRVIILVDKCNDKNSKRYDNFLENNPHLEKNGQFLVLPCDALEKYYPDPYKKMDNEINALKKGGKVKLAQNVAQKITKEQFEKEMDIIYQALEKCKEMGF